ncbi:MAG TPA: MerR family transcriptional regulator [Spirochaetia bacterium]
MTKSVEQGPVSPLQIGEVARQAGVSIRTVRFYEEKGLLAATSTTSGGIRLYTARDVNRLVFIRRLKVLGLSIEEIRECLGTIPADANHRTRIARTIELLTMQREKIEEQIANLQGVREEIELSLAKMDGCLACRNTLCPEQCTNQQHIL